MKKFYSIIAVVLISATLWAQSPQKMSYQAVIRNAENNLVSNQQVGMQISILQGSVTGTPVYTENHTATTNANGLVSIEIGTGTTSDDFSVIDWTSGLYFIKTETDPTGGTSYSITGTSQLLSVPYALHAKTAETVVGGITETDPVFGSWDKSSGISITEIQISDLGAYLAIETDPIFSSSQANNIKATDITNLSNLSGTNTGDQDLSSMATKTALGDSMLLVRSEIPDVGGFLTSESDPAYAGSQAANIIEDDIINLGNLSGVNTGDQNLSSVLSQGTNAGNNIITNLADPTAAQDAATKAYVDQLEQQIEAMQNSLIAAGSMVRDQDGNVYGVVTIGTQKWMTENLKTTIYKDGTDIPLVTDNTEWCNLSTPGYCWLKNDEATYKNTYGALYNWYTVNTGELCPTGWHVPTDAEWTTLTDYLGGPDKAGGKLKETGTTHWHSPNVRATNETGFTALPGATRGIDGTFDNTGFVGYWWGAIERRARWIYFESGQLLTLPGTNQGASVRCMKD